ncbi:MAG: tRNA pseudouridine(55) synthase TruB [Bacteroidales bacterium]|nr:tRNA pseudouridine(55) synthase TruB [Bacteroidales bacterium]
MSALIAKAGITLSRSIDDYPEGIIIPIDKPYRWTSADVIRKVKWAACRHFEKKNLKVGHAGTLDPLATGVLLVCIGKATKLAEDLQKHEKQYLAGVCFGATTPSYDREKEVDKEFALDGVSEESIRQVLPSFLGEQEQVAPLFSAKSVDGVRAYELARKAYKQAARTGEDFDHSASELLSRQMINIPAIELVSFTPDFQAPAYESERNIHVNDLSGYRLANADVLVTCSKGTYIRALARDLGEALGSGAFLSSLRRTRNGGFKVKDALSVDQTINILSHE